MKHEFAEFDALRLQMTALADVSDMLKAVRRDSKLSQEELARRAGVARTTVARMETLARNDMSEALCDSAVDVGHELIEAARNEPQWRMIAKQMLHAWDDGMTALRSPKK